jgi:hypothetical protein
VKTLETKDRITFKIGKKLSPKEIERLIEEGLEELALPPAEAGRFLHTAPSTLEGASLHCS